MNTQKTIAFSILIAAVVGGIFYLDSQKVSHTNSATVEIQTTMNQEEKAALYEPAKEIMTPDGFINTPSAGSGQATPITISEFVGKKVVLIDFWTYSCINCQRTTPYLNAWYEKYRDQGLVIVGIHTPEFEFEKDYDNVRAAVEKLGIRFPVVLDNDYSTWTAYKNQYWPRKYLIDIDGYIVYDHIGEGAYAETEKKIQEALKERAGRLGMEMEITESLANPENAVSLEAGKVKSPEVYFGWARNEFLGNGTASPTGEKVFSLPKNISSNKLYLEGTWRFDYEYAENKGTASIVFEYEAKNVYLVASSENDLEIEIYKDGELVKKINVRDEQLYPLIEDSNYGPHTLKIKIPSAGLKAFTFTFG